VSKLRENAKTVIGVGVKQSTSDLFISNCDEFIYYDDLVRVEPRRKTARRQPAPAPNESSTAARERPSHKVPAAPTASEALDLLAKTLDALRAERGEDYPDPLLTHETGDEAAVAGISTSAPMASRRSTTSCSRRKSAACSS
jgi:hypothetical protein